MKAREFVERHKKLESDISDAINALVSDYQDEVGLGVRSIDIDQLETTNMGDEFRTFARYASVKLDLSE